MRARGIQVAIFIIIITLLAFTVLILASSIKWLGYEDGLRLGKETNKLVFIYFFSPTCPYCKLMKRDTLQDPRIIDILSEKYIPVKVNVVERPDLARKFGVPGVPCVLLITPDEEPTKGLVGYASPEELLKILKSHNEEEKKG